MNQPNGLLEQLNTAMLARARSPAGSVRVLNTTLRGIAPPDALALRLRWGVLFQQGGLFSSLTVLENVGLPLREHRKMPTAEVDTVAIAKLALVGLGPEVGSKYPFELSGGMQKRAALARAIVLEPELLFLDEPTAGLDPHNAEGIDTLILRMCGQWKMTVIMVTHDLDLLWQVADRVAVLGDGTVQGVGSMEELGHLSSPAVRYFFDGPRARAALPPLLPEALSKPK